MTATDVHTETPQLLLRSYDFEQTPKGDGKTLEGFVAVYDQWARISNAFEGDFDETVRFGAFARTVRANPRPVIQFDHGQHPLLGSIPIAAPPRMKEEKRGFWVSTTVHDNWLTEPVRDAIVSGAIRGMSMRFYPAAENGERWDPMREKRELLDLHVLEMGPVVFPAYEGTTVNMRSQQFADALKDPTLRHDLALALLLEGRDEDLPADTPDDEARADQPPADDVVEVRTDEETPADPDTPEDVVAEVSAPNPARTMATLIAVRTSQAVTRSNYEPEGLPDP